MSDCRTFEDLKPSEIDDYRMDFKYFIYPSMEELMINLSDGERGYLFDCMFEYMRWGHILDEDNLENSNNDNFTPAVLAVLRYWCLTEEKRFKKYVNKRLYNENKASKRG